MSEKQRGTDVFVAGPHIGELGWECFCWQPLVRNVVLSTPDIRRAIVYSSPGRDLLYDGVAEIRDWRGLYDEPEDVPHNESECLVWHDMANHENELNNLIERMVTSARAEFGQQIRVFTPAALLPNMLDPRYMQGRPDLLRGDGAVPDCAKGLGDTNMDVALLCVRDRAMSDQRNWDYGSWHDLADALADNGVLPAFIGQVRDREAWERDRAENCVDLTDRTTIDDCIRIFAAVRARALVCGATGTVHLASRCACDHLSWGSEKNWQRYHETNWFGAQCRVLLQGFDPDPDAVANEIVAFFANGRRFM